MTVDAPRRPAHEVILPEDRPETPKEAADRRLREAADRANAAERADRQEEIRKKSAERTAEIRAAHEATQEAAMAALANARTREEAGAALNRIPNTEALTPPQQEVHAMISRKFFPELFGTAAPKPPLEIRTVVPKTELMPGHAKDRPEPPGVVDRFLKMFRAR